MSLGTALARSERKYAASFRPPGEHDPGRVERVPRAEVARRERIGPGYYDPPPPGGGRDVGVREPGRRSAGFAAKARGEQHLAQGDNLATQRPRFGVVQSRATERTATANLTYDAQAHVVAGLRDSRRGDPGPFYEFDNQPPRRQKTGGLLGAAGDMPHFHSED